MGSAFDATLARPNLRCAAAGNIVVARLVDRLRGDDIDAFDAFSHAVRAKFRRVAILTIVDGIPLPDPEVRSRSAMYAERALLEFGEGVDIIVMRGDALWMAAARAVVANIYLLSKRHGAHKIVSSEDAGAVEVAAALPADVAHVRAVVDAFAAFDAAITTTKA